MPKLDLNGLIASLLSIFFTPKGLIAFLIGLTVGFLIAVAPFLVIGLIAVFGIVVFAFREKLDFKKIKALIRGNPPSPSSSLPPPPPPDEKKEEKKDEPKKKRITIELD